MVRSLLKSTLMMTILEVAKIYEEKLVQINPSKLIGIFKDSS